MSEKKLGFIHDAFYDKGYGYIREVTEDWSKPELYFILKTSTPNLCSGKLFLFKEGGIGKSLYAKELEQPDKSFLKSIDLKIFKRQRINLKCNNDNIDVINFILQNYLDGNFHTHIKTINNIQSFLANDFETFDFNTEVEKYHVSLEGHGFTRVGKDDKAWLAIESSNYYYGKKWDPYLNKLLPPIYKEISSVSSYSRWEGILGSLKEDIGDEGIQKLILEAETIETNIKNNILVNYDKKQHELCLLEEIDNIYKGIYNEIGFTNEDNLKPL